MLVGIYAYGCRHIMVNKSEPGAPPPTKPKSWVRPCHGAIISDRAGRQMAQAPPARVADFVKLKQVAV